MMHKSRRWILAVTLIIFSALLLVACDGGDAATEEPEEEHDMDAMEDGEENGT